MHGTAKFIHAVDYTATQMANIQKYLDDPDVYEVRINRFGEVVIVTADGKKIVEDPSITEAYLRGLTSHLQHLSGIADSPVSNVILRCGSRGVICWPPAVVEGTVLIAIRKHLDVTKTLEQLKSEGRFDAMKHIQLDQQLELTEEEANLLACLEQGKIVDFLRGAVRHKKNICVSGKTGSGKTTFTRSLLLEVPSDERVILLEDVHEVSADVQDEIGYMLYGNEAGRLSASECLKTCMRLSPDRIFLTELRDDAAWDYLASANTGHPGGIFSTHADSAISTPARIATLVKASPIGRSLDYQLIHRTIATTLDVVVYIENRQVREILYDPMAKKRAMFQ